MKTSSEFRAEAREVLSMRWGKMAVFTLVYFLVAGGIAWCVGLIIPFVGSFAASLALVPVEFAFTVAFLSVVRADWAEVGDLFKEFNNRVFVTMILCKIYTWLWSLLLIIPGIVKAYSYAMTPYLLRDNEELEGNAAIEESMRMMSGHKWKLFCLDFSFIGWWILACLTLGIGMLWLIPYQQTSRAAFYEELKAQYIAG